MIHLPTVHLWLWLMASVVGATPHPTPMAEPDPSSVVSDDHWERG